MQPEQIVANKELSRRLEELGFPQSNSCFYWRIDVPKNWLVKTPRKRREIHIAAPTAEEIWHHCAKMIGPFWVSWDGEDPAECWYGLEITNDNVGYPGKHYIDIDGDTITNSLAKLLIWLAENGYVKWS